MKKYLSIVLTGLLLVFTVLTSIPVFADTTQAATGTLKVHMLKIGDGRNDCFIVELPNGETMVIDVPSGAGGSTTLTNKLKALGISSVKYLVGTHSHADHIGGIDTFLNSGFKIDNTQIYYPAGIAQEGEADYNNMLKAANARKLTIARLVRHDDILDTTYNGKDLEIKVISPIESKINGGDDDYKMINSASLALQVRYGDKAMLFMADCQWQTENDILVDTDTSDLWGQVLKVGHHGVLSAGHTTTTDAFLDKIKPQYAFITNEDTSINSDIRSRLRSRNIDYWIAGVSGDVWIATDSTNPWTYSGVPTWSRPPVITIGDYIKTATNQDITVTASTNKGTLNAASHTFTENGSFEFVATDVATGTESKKTVTITNIDKVPPELTIGEYTKTFTNQDITVTAVTNEGTLNAASYTFTENGSFEFVATDAAGNITKKVVTITNIDKVPPAVVILTPANDAKYILNQKLLASWTAADNSSGIAAANGSVNSGGVIDTSTVGPKAFTVTATDIAGNITTKTVNYKVIYAFGGVLQPIYDNKPDANKAGSAIPVKFQLKDADNKYITNAEAKAYFAKLSNGIPGTEIEAVSTGSAKDGNIFRYDSTDNQYIFNLSTKGWEPGSYQIIIKLNDGCSYIVKIDMK